MATMGSPKPFGLRDVKITNIEGTTQVDLPSGQMLSFNPRLSSGELYGDDAITSIIAFIIAIDWALESGGIPLNALSILTGQPATAAGTTPNQTVTYNLAAGDNMPYFKIYGKAISEDTDDVHVKLYKCKCTALEGQFQGENFYVSKCSGVAIDNGSGGIIDIVHNETAANLPTS